MYYLATAVSMAQQLLHGKYATVPSLIFRCIFVYLIELFSAERISVLDIKESCCYMFAFSCVQAEYCTDCAISLRSCWTVSEYLSAKEKLCLFVCLILLCIDVGVTAD